MIENILNEDWDKINLDYEGENKFASFFSSQGNIHSYPAKAVPEMINDLITKLMKEYDIKSILDPFVGSGTTALEAKYIGLDFYGSDLNPLAVLLSRTKVLTIDNTEYVKKQLISFTARIKDIYKDKALFPLVNFDNIEYWFKEDNIKELSFIKFEIDAFLKKSKKYKKVYALILLTTFSSTIRAVSLTRNGEFKLYRMSTNDILKHEANALNIFSKKLEYLLAMLVTANSKYECETKTEIYLRNAKKIDYMGNKKVDLVITSPPYGDSQSTVAYGQFSRLSVQWMSDLMNRYLNIICEYDNCDQYLLGGKKSDFNLKNESNFYDSKEIIKLINDMDRVIYCNIKEREEVRQQLDYVIESLNKNNLEKKDIYSNETLLKLIKERVRLDIYRNISRKKSKLNNKKIKLIAKEKSKEFIDELFSNDKKLKYKRKEQMKKKLPNIKETINRNITSMPKRKIEVIDFFKDLYKVVLETDRVVSDEGIQAWIVGHRTVLGEISVNMQDILKEWFENMNYSVITSLERKYSFKRMPHHINSTIIKNREVSTMMNEYILIVKKNR